MILRDTDLRGAKRRSHQRAAGRLGAVVAGLLVVAGTTTVFDASSFVLGSPAPTGTLTCNDNWTGGGPTADWGSAANWTAGVPNSTGVDVCIAGDAPVLLDNASYSIGELTVTAGSSLAIGAGSTGDTTASLSVSSGLLNDGSLTVGPSGTSGHPALTVEGPVTNTGTLTVEGVMGLGDNISTDSPSTTSSTSTSSTTSTTSKTSTTSGASPTTALSNDGTVGIAPGGLIDLEGSSTITNESDGLLAFGIDGPPSSVASYGRITNGTLSLAGSADPVSENNFTPSPGAEYVVDMGTSIGTFESVLNNATADYSHPGEVGLTGGAPATVTSTSVTSSVAAGSSYGQAVQLTAKVAPVPRSNPTGSVSFTAGGLLLGSSPVTTSATGDTTAALTVSNLPVGSDPVTATYGGDVVFGPSTSPVVTQLVNPDPTNVTITPSSSSPEPGQPVIDTATVSLVTPGTGLPTGTVSFTDDGNPVTGCQALSLPTVAPLQVSCTETYGSGATHSIVASYSGDADDAGSNVSLLQAVGQIPTQTTVTSSSPTSTYGQDLTLTATVTPTGTASGSPTGTVTFYDYETNPLATVDVSTATGAPAATATATFSISSLMGGLHSISATYSGDATFGSSASGSPVSLHVAEAATVVTVASSADPTVVGQPVVFTATISSPVSGETGTVQFVDNGYMIGSGSVSGGQATFQAGSLTLGAHPITAVYEGDDDFIGTASTNTVTQTVNPASTSTDVTGDHDPGLVGQAITYTATIAVDAPGSGTPTGSVSFSDGGSPIPNCQGLALPPAPPLEATCTQVYDTSADHSITATYSGDADFATSAGTLAENVSPVSTTTTVVSSPPASTSGQSVTLTAIVAPTSGTADPDGAVTFTANGTGLGSSVLSTTDGVTGTSMLITTLPQGTDSVTASYGGGSGFLASSSASSASVAVSRAATTLGLLTSDSPSAPGSSVTFTATVFPTTGSGETGSVTFFDNGVRIGTGTVSSGQATLSVTTLPAGDDAITAAYAGDANFIGSSTTGPVIQLVEST